MKLKKRSFVVFIFASIVHLIVTRSSNALNTNSSTKGGGPGGEARDNPQSWCHGVAGGLYTKYTAHKSIKRALKRQFSRHVPDQITPNCFFNLTAGPSRCARTLP